MGSLNLPSAGRVLFDTNAFIFSVERIEPYCSLLRTVWQSARTGAIEVVASELVLLEALVKPIRERDVLLQRLYRELLLDSEDVHLLPIDIAVLNRAAEIRAETRLKTPDAIHAATALHHSVALVVTNDSDLRRVDGLPVEILSEALQRG